MAVVNVSLKSLNSFITDLENTKKELNIIVNNIQSINGKMTGIWSGAAMMKYSKKSELNLSNMRAYIKKLENFSTDITEIKKRTEDLIEEESRIGKSVNIGAAAHTDNALFDNSTALLSLKDNTNWISEKCGDVYTELDECNYINEISSEHRGDIENSINNILIRLDSYRSKMKKLSGFCGQYFESAKKFNSFVKQKMDRYATHNKALYKDMSVEGTYLNLLFKYNKQEFWSMDTTKLSKSELSFYKNLLLQADISSLTDEQLEKWKKIIKFEKVLYVNDSDGAFGMGHSAIILVTADGEGYLCSVTGDMSQGYKTVMSYDIKGGINYCSDSSGNPIFITKDKMEKFYRTGEFNGLRSRLSDSAEENYDRWIEIDITEEEGFKMFNKAEEFRKQYDTYNLYGNNCGMVAQKILKAGGKDFAIPIGGWSEMDERKTLKSVANDTVVTSASTVVLATPVLAAPLNAIVGTAYAGATSVFIQIRDAYEKDYNDCTIPNNAFNVGAEVAKEEGWKVYCVENASVQNEEPLSDKIEQVCSFTQDPTITGAVQAGCAVVGIIDDIQEMIKKD